MAPTSDTLSHGAVRATVFAAFLHSVSLLFSCTVFRCSRNFISIVTMKKTYCLIVVNTVDRQAGFTVTVPATAQGRGRARLSFPIPGESLQRTLCCSLLLRVHCFCCCSLCCSRRAQRGRQDWSYACLLLTAQGYSS